jgi:hypothetical protein
MSDLFPSLVPAFAAVGQAVWRALRCCGRGIKKSARVFVLYLLPPLIVIHIAATLITGRLVAKELDDLAAAGHPLTLAEITPPDPPPGQNAADVYQQAFDAYRVSSEDAKEVLREDLSMHAEAMAIAREVVAANRRYYEFVNRASRMPTCVFPVDWDAGLDTAFPHLTRMREAARMLRLRVTVLNTDGLHDEALADCLTIFRLAEHAKADPILIAHLVSFAIQGYAVDALQETLCIGSPPSDACRDAFDMLHPSVERASFLPAMQSELAFGIWFFDYVRSSRAKDVAEMISQSVPAGSLLRSEKWCRIALALYRTVGRPLLNLDQLAALRMWSDYLAAFKLPWPESQERIEATDAAVDALPAWRSLFTRMAFPVFIRAVWSRDRATASLRAAAIALSLKAYYADHGAYPDSLGALEEAGWTLPADPFGGGPYHYRREGDGFVVWSIGPDVDDDNAARDYDAYREQTEADREERERNPYDYDVIFRCSP